MVSDYSSIVYEAYLLGKPVIFYVTDMDTYLVSPGLNANPLELCPTLCASTSDALISLVNQALANPDPFIQALEPFAAPAFKDADVAPSDLLEAFAARKPLER